MNASLAFRAALARRILLAAGVAASFATVACGDDSVAGGGGAGGDAPGGAAQGAGGEGGSAEGGAASGGGGEGGVGEGGAATGGGGQGGEGGAAEGGSAQGGGGVGGAAVGRPFMVDHVAQRARVSEGPAAAPSWGVGDRFVPRLDGLTAADRARLATAWANEASYEHASVASFSKLSLELLAHGAPAHLVSAAHEAALDEIQHASLGFALASAYAGVPLSPGPLPAAARVGFASDLAELAVAAVTEGCVGETLAALVAGAQLAAARDPGVRSVLGRVARDEALHAELAWRTVVWAIEVGGDPVRDAVRAAFDEAIKAVERTAPSDELAFHAHGRLSGAEAQAERARGVREVVRPAVTALLG